MLIDIIKSLNLRDLKMMVLIISVEMCAMILEPVSRISNLSNLAVLSLIVIIPVSILISHLISEIL